MTDPDPLVPRPSVSQDVTFSLDLDDADGSQHSPQRPSSVSSGGGKSVDERTNTNEYEDEKERLLRKIELIGGKIKQAVMAKEADVEEFLRMTSSISSTISADNPQLMRVRQMFDKKNKKSTQTINALQKKLENYQKKLKDLNEGVMHRGITETMLTNIGEGLKDVKTNIKESITEYTGSVMAVPKDIALKLKKSTFGSSTDVTAGTSTSGDESSEQKRKSVSPMSKESHGKSKHDYERASSQTEESSSLVQEESGRSMTSFGVCSPEVLQLNLEPLYAELRFIRDTLDELRTHIQQEYAYFHGALHEEKYRYQRLEEQVNDTTELHQAEVLNLKQEVQGLDGRLQYQFQERLQDLQDMISQVQDRTEASERHIRDIQLIVGIRGLHGVSPTSEMVRAVIILLQIVIALLIALWHVAWPCIRTRARFILTFMGICFVAFIWNRWDRIFGSIGPWSSSRSNGSASLP